MNVLSRKKSKAISFFLALFFIFGAGFCYGQPVSASVDYKVQADCSDGYHEETISEGGHEESGSVMLCCLNKPDFSFEKNTNFLTDGKVKLIALSAHADNILLPDSDPENDSMYAVSSSGGEKLSSVLKKE